MKKTWKFWKRRLNQNAIYIIEDNTGLKDEDLVDSAELDNKLKGSVIHEPRQVPTEWVEYEAKTKQGRNEICMCSSGKKYKRCCIR